MSREAVAGIRRLVLIFVAAVVILAFIPGSSGLINLATSLFVGAFVGAVFSLAAATMVEAFTGDSLKTIFLSFEVGALRFSVSLFVVATIVVKYLIFH